MTKSHKGSRRLNRIAKDLHTNKYRQRVHGIKERKRQDESLTGVKGFLDTEDVIGDINVDD